MNKPNFTHNCASVEGLDDEGAEEQWKREIGKAGPAELDEKGECQKEETQQACIMCVKIAPSGRWRSMRLSGWMHRPDLGK